MSKKPLLLFAHKGEAQAFFSHCKHHPMALESLPAYENDSYFLLITKEGLQETTKNLTWFLASYADVISKIINLGIAGALSAELKLADIYSIRTIYGEEQFNNFKTADLKSVIDIISAKNRITNIEDAQRLFVTAPLVDREAWAIGSVANKFNKELYCYKLVSDFADGKDTFKQIKEKAADYSERLYQYYQKITSDLPQ